MKQIGVQDIAKACGVSPSTVCRALNEKADISDATREKVKKACEKLGYIRNTAASNLRSKKSRLIACLAPDNSNELFIEKLYFLKKQVLDNGYKWQLFGFYDAKDIYEQFQDVLSQRPLGVVICNFTPSEQMVDLAEKNDVPLVCYDCEFPKIDSVVLDREKGVYEAVDFLLKSGKKQVLLLGDAGGVRASAYKKAYRDNGLKYDQKLIIPDTFGRDLFQYGYDMIKKYQDLVSFNAVFAVNDAAAIGGIRAINECHKMVPEDIAVVGFDDIMVSKYTVPALSTVAQPKEQMAEKSIEFLLKRVNNQNIKHQYEKLKTTFIHRETC